ncbi:site-specific integrase [Streptomyces europaeiscabiei]|uniref:tyrosine-type recombinase/integrase n=1 Tax=Streptomyces europaeiscabiei TaxID=146819 RepID=UPI0029BE70ED|nr:site-specific integrase [Streptomyces europaeiscabiei]MDX3708815.1 site-specific integrase [Streptomyces europaeiscabiei]
MTTATKAATPTLRSLAGAEADALMKKFPARPRPGIWPTAVQTREEVLERLQQPPLRMPTAGQTQRMAGARVLLQWLETFPGSSWHERWQASPATEPVAIWADQARQWAKRLGRKPAPRTLSAGLLALVCADVIRPDWLWVVSKPSRHLRPAIQATRDSAGFARVEARIPPEVLATRYGTEGLKVIAEFLVVYGGCVQDIGVGDFMARLHATSGSRSHAVRLAYGWLKDMGQFPSDAPPTLRNITMRAGQTSTASLVDRYQLRCRPIRNLLVDYLEERRAAIDYNTLKVLSASLAKNFWADLETHHPGIDSLHLADEVSAAWKKRLAIKTVPQRQPDGTTAMVTGPRHNVVGIKSYVRAFYLDIAQWALEEPERWGPWAVPCPIREMECSSKKNERRQKVESDKRTRERMPVLPTLVRVAEQRLKDARTRLEAANAAPLGSTFSVLGETFSVPATTVRSDGRPTRLKDDSGRVRFLNAEERNAFFAWASIEILRHTGIRIEELLEIGHHSIISYKLPSTGDIVPLLQIAPSKTDQERLLLVTPELADVLSTAIARVRSPRGAVPAIPFYDGHERTWNAPQPLLFQYESGHERRRLTFNFVRRAINETLAASGLTDSSGNRLTFQPHDFRRIFITDAILNGLPPHIAQVVAGHDSINTTMGYAAIYPTDAIEAHQAFIARRRALRPVEEYRAVTPEEWQEFLGHFERRKLALGECGRAYGTDCAHEHACIRCPVLIVDFADMPRMVEIRDNLAARIEEAEREHWLGEVEGLSVSHAAAEEKIAQLEARQARKESPVFLGIPSFEQIVARTSEVESP